ncbi:MAG: peptide ABC transporter substrate-binding protein [Pseudomonadota bacterium]
MHAGWTKWLLTLALALTLAQPGAARAAAKDELVIGVSQFPTAFHPNLEAHVTQGYVLAMTSRPFTAFDADWELVCMLCTELPTLENGKAVIEKQDDGTDGIALTYTIQEGATWGDGTPVTTDDVLFTYEVGKHPDSGVVSSEGYRRITSIDVVDDKTFVMHVDRVTFRYNAINDFDLVPAHLERPIFEADPANYRNRTTYETDIVNPALHFGPYKVTEVSTGAYLVLEPNETWWGEAPFFKKIVIKAIENTAALEANLLSGSIDMIAGEAGVTIDQALAFEKRHGEDYQITYKPGLIYEHLDLNLDNPILADVRVRKALIQGIDREAISQQLFEGKQPVAHGSVHPLDWIYFENVLKYEENLEAAGALLDEAGWMDMRDGSRHNEAGEPLALELMTTAGNRTRELVQQVLQSQWKRLGVDITIRNEPARVFFGETMAKRKYTGLGMFAWISSPENVPLTTLNSEQIPSEDNGWSGQNYTGYQSERMDELIDGIERELDREKREAMWHELQTLYAEDLPAIPLYFRANPHIWPTWLKGIVPTGHLGSSALGVETWYAEDAVN